MPIIKSQKKRVEITKGENARNNARRTEVKNAIKKFETAIKENNLAEAGDLLLKAVSLIDAARVDGLYHINNASRKKARLSKMLSDAKKAAENK